MIRTINEIGYDILIVEGGNPINPLDDNVDVLVRFPTGVDHAAVFATLRGIQSRMEYFKVSGECAGGLYFWAADLVIVASLTDAVIRATVKDLLESGEFASAFSEGSDPE
jgi:hypothetical protein